MPNRASKSALYRRIAEQVWPCRMHLAIIIALDLVAVPLALLVPLPLTLTIDALTGSEAGFKHYIPALGHTSRERQLLAAAALMIAIGVVQHVVSLVNWRMRTYTGEQLVLSFRSRLFAHVQRLSLSFHDQRGAADPTYRIQHDAVSIQNLTLQGVLPFVCACVSLLAMVYVTARIDWMLASLAILGAPCMFLLTHYFSATVHEQWTAVKDRDSTAMNVVQEVLSSVRVVKAFGQEDREHDRFVEHSTHYMHGQLRLSRIQSTFYVLAGMTVVAVSSVALYLGARHVMAGVITVGQLLLMMTYLAKLQEPLSVISGKVIEMQSWLVSMDRALALLDEQADIHEPVRAKPIRRAIGAVRMRNVTFGYQKDRPVLRNVNLNIAPGMRVAVVGPSGAGKSTLMSLLMRLYDTQAGDVMLDCVNVREWKLGILREQFTIVLQEPVLFSTTIAENISYGRPNATHAEIVAAAKAADAHDFIMALPLGYATEVGQRGSCLSGGQRQRIALARAFLKNAPIVILDEPTSALDSRSEASVVEATERLMRGRTTFIIAHRVTTIESCDIKLLVQNGTVTVLDNGESSAALAAAHSAWRPEFESEGAPHLVT